MKFSPTLPLALAFAAGVAGAAAAQTTAAPGTTGASPQLTAPDTSSSSATQPNQMPSRVTTPQMQAHYGQPNAGSPPPAHPVARRGLATSGNPSVRQAQLKLHAMGLYNGPSDGIMDPNTRAAIARFQQQRGLKRTESLNPQTLAALNTSQATGYGASSRPAPAATPRATGATGYNAAPSSAGGNTGPARMQR